MRKTLDSLSQSIQAVKLKGIDRENENYGMDCYDKLQAIRNGIKAQEMTHREFVAIVRSSPFCRPIKRHFKECPICRALGIPQRGW